MRPTPITRAEGVTDAERYLDELCQRSFLSLWSYPAPFRDQGVGKGQGKEICDLISEVSFGACTVVLALHFGPAALILTLVVRSIFAGASVMAQEVAQMAAFAAALMGLYFGMTQSSFFMGDSLGGLAGGWLYGNAGLATTLVIASSLILTNGLFFTLFLVWVERRYGGNAASRDAGQLAAAQSC